MKWQGKSLQRHKLPLNSSCLNPLTDPMPANSYGSASQQHATTYTHMYCGIGREEENAKNIALQKNTLFLTEQKGEPAAQRYFNSREAG